MAYTTFEENGVRKQEEAYKISYAKRQFAYSCEECSSKNRRGGRQGCSDCPIKQAHITAMVRIETDKNRMASCNFKYGAKKKNNTCGNVTIVMNFY